MVLVAYAGPVRKSAALRDSVLRLPTDSHLLLVTKTSFSLYLLTDLQSPVLNVNKTSFLSLFLLLLR